MRRTFRLLMLALIVGGLLVLWAIPAFAQDGETGVPADSIGFVAVTIAAAAVVVQKIIERLKVAFTFLQGTVISVVAVALGVAAAYGFDLSVGATGSEFIDKLFAALTVAFGAGTINDFTE